MAEHCSQFCRVVIVFSLAGTVLNQETQILSQIPVWYQFYRQQAALARHGQGPIVTPLVRGSLQMQPDGFLAVPSVTLVQHNGINIVFDTPMATDTQAANAMLTEMARNGKTPQQVQILVTSHGHFDHYGHVNLFPLARHFSGLFEMTANKFTVQAIDEFKPVELTSHVDVWYTPGHTQRDISLMVREVPCCGTVSLSGDLFYDEASVLNSTVWQANALNSTAGILSRNRVLCTADYIIPGHGTIFQVTQTMRASAGCPNQPFASLTDASDPALCPVGSSIQTCINPWQSWFG